MSFVPEGRPGPNEVAELLEGIDQFLARSEEDLKRLDDEIREAEKKSKAVIRVPDP